MDSTSNLNTPVNSTRLPSKNAGRFFHRRLISSSHHPNNGKTVEDTNLNSSFGKNSSQENIIQGGLQFRFSEMTQNNQLYKQSAGGNSNNTASFLVSPRISIKQSFYELQEPKDQSFINLSQSMTQRDLQQQHLNEQSHYFRSPQGPSLSQSFRGSSLQGRKISQPFENSQQILLNQSLTLTSKRRRNFNLYSFMQSEYLSRKNQANYMKYTKQYDLVQFQYDQKCRLLELLQQELNQIRLNNQYQIQEDQSISVKNLSPPSNKISSPTFITSQEKILTKSSMYLPQQSSVSCFSSPRSSQQLSLQSSQYSYSNIDFLNQIKKNLIKQIDSKEEDIVREEQTQAQLKHHRNKEKLQKVADNIRMNEIKPMWSDYQRASKDFQRIQIINSSRRIVSLNLIGQRKIELNFKKQFYEEMVSNKVNALKMEAIELKQINNAINKRQKRISEIKEYIEDVKERNQDLESQEKAFIQQIENKNLEFKVISGLEVLSLLEQALIKLTNLKAIDQQQQKVGIDILYKVQDKIVESKVPDFTSQDVIQSNSKMLEFKVYDQYFSQYLEETEGFQLINDEFLSNRYHDIHYQIKKNSEKYYQLVEQSECKKALIEKFTSFKQQLQRDCLILGSFGDMDKTQNQEQTFNNLKFLVEKRKKFENIKFNISSFEVFTAKDRQQNEYFSPPLTIKKNSNKDLNLKSPVKGQRHSFANQPRFKSKIIQNSNQGAQRRLNIMDKREQLNFDQFKEGMEVNYSNDDMSSYYFLQDMVQFVTSFQETVDYQRKHMNEYLISYPDALNYIKESKYLSGISRKLSKKLLKKQLSQYHKSSSQPSPLDLQFPIEEPDYINPNTKAIDPKSLLSDKLQEDLFKQQQALELNLQEQEKDLDHTAKAKLD